MATKFAACCSMLAARWGWVGRCPAGRGRNRRGCARVGVGVRRWVGPRHRSRGEICPVLVAIVECLVWVCVGGVLFARRRTCLYRSVCGLGGCPVEKKKNPRCARQIFRAARERGCVCVGLGAAAAAEKQISKVRRGKWCVSTHRRLRKSKFCKKCTLFSKVSKRGSI